MHITGVRVEHVVIPMLRPTRSSAAVRRSREYIIAVVDTSEGIHGVGYTFTLTDGENVKQSIVRVLTPLIAGQDPLMSERLWSQMYRITLYEGRKGVMMRAMSALDIALWDIRGKVAGLPLYKLLGGFRDRIPCYASAGYYYDDDPHYERLVEEVRQSVRDGFTAVKMKVGGAPTAVDRERVRAVREAIGQDTLLMVDATNAWHAAKDAIRLARQIEEFDIYFLEEPLLPDNLPGLQAIGRAIDIPVAVGEIEGGRWGFRDIIVAQAADIIQPDVMAVGGISEWMKIAAIAETWQVPIIPHRAAEIHAHLAAAVPMARMVEYYAPAADYVGVDRVLKHGLRMEKGHIVVPDIPGVGLEIDWDALAGFLVP